MGWALIREGRLIERGLLYGFRDFRVGVYWRRALNRELALNSLLGFDFP